MISHKGTSFKVTISDTQNLIKKIGDSIFSGGNDTVRLPNFAASLHLFLKHYLFDILAHSILTEILESPYVNSHRFIKNYKSLWESIKNKGINQEAYLQTSTMSRIWYMVREFELFINREYEKQNIPLNNEERDKTAEEKYKYLLKKKALTKKYMIKWCRNLKLFYKPGIALFTHLVFIISRRSKCLITTEKNFLLKKENL